MTDDNPYADRPYEIGKGKTPKHTRWKKGFCPNPKGRPKYINSFESDLLKEMQELITLTENGKRLEVTKQQAHIKSILSKAIQGDHKASCLLLGCLAKIQTNTPNDRQKGTMPPLKTNGDLTAEDQAIIQRYFKENYRP